MNTKALIGLLALVCASAATAALAGQNQPANAGQPAAAENKPTTIPWDQIGAKAAADYQGGGLTVTPTVGGARLHCVFQRLDGEATAEGLWLTSTVPNQANDRFRVRAVSV